MPDETALEREQNWLEEIDKELDRLAKHLQRQEKNMQDSDLQDHVGSRRPEPGAAPAWYGLIAAGRAGAIAR
jgi:hypothetical protein